MIERTDKPINRKTLLADEMFVRKAMGMRTQISGLTKSDYYKFPDDFEFEEQYEWSNGGIRSSSEFEGATRTVTGVHVSLKGYDSELWLNAAGTGTGYFHGNFKFHPPYSDIAWINLLIEYGYAKVRGMDENDS